MSIFVTLYKDCFERPIYRGMCINRAVFGTVGPKKVNTSTEHSSSTSRSPSNFLTPKIVGPCVIAQWWHWLGTSIVEFLVFVHRPHIDALDSNVHELLACLRLKLFRFTLRVAMSWKLVFLSTSDNISLTMKFCLHTYYITIGPTSIRV